MNNVVLPAPLTPSKPKHSPLGTPKEILFTATRLPNIDLNTLVTSMTLSISNREPSVWVTLRHSSITSQSSLAYCPLIVEDEDVVDEVIVVVVVVVVRGFEVEEEAETDEDEVEEAEDNEVDEDEIGDLDERIQWKKDELAIISMKRLRKNKMAPSEAK